MSNAAIAKGTSKVHAFGKGNPLTWASRPVDDELLVELFSPDKWPVPHYRQITLKSHQTRAILTAAELRGYVPTSDH